MRVQHAGARRVGLAPPRMRRERPAERLVLAVGNVVEAQLGPALAPVGRVDVGQERRISRPEHARVAPVWSEGREELDQLARDHRAGLRPRMVRPVDHAHIRIGGERLQQRRAPALDRRRVLGEERHDVRAGGFRPEVASAAVPERGRIDLEHLGPRAACDRGRAVVRAGVDHQQLVGALTSHGGEQLIQVARPVLDGHDHSDARGHRARQLLGLLQPPDDPADRAQRAAKLVGAAAAHERVQVDAPAIEPVDAVLRGRDRGVGARDELRVLRLEPLDAGAQGLDLRLLRGRAHRARG